MESESSNISVDPADVLSPGSSPLVPTPEPDPTGEVGTEPAKVLRLGSMVKGLLDEARAANLDEPGRARLAEIYRTTVEELSGALSKELGDELVRMSPPFTSSVPSESELRIAHAQLVGWLEGLFHGIQASLFAQQAMAQASLQQGSPGPSSAGESGDGVRGNSYL